MNPPAAARVRPAAAPVPRPKTGPDVGVLGWGHALPAFRYRQADLAEFLVGAMDPAAARRVRAAFRGSRIRSRGSVLPDFAPGASRRLFVPGHVPTTAERMRVFAAEAPGLAEAAARAALDGSGGATSAITHLLFITCTGFAAPGPDRDLILRLGLSPAVRRLQIGYQGCSAGIVGLRTAADIVRGDASARVLVVAVELASLHFQESPGEEDLRGHSLFADGAGAAVVAAVPRRGGRGHFAGIRLHRGSSRLLPGSADHMTWDVGDTGFLMRLSPRVPDTLTAELPSFVAAAADPAAIRHWAVHPGGPVILDRVGEALSLPAESLEVSRAVLAEHGNMSSATIFFVLERIAAAGGAGDGLALAFGPGLTVEGLGFRVTA